MLPTACRDMGSTATYYSCNIGTYYYDVTVASTWSSNNTPVIQMDSSVHNRADALAAGSATITTTVVACTRYDTNPDLPCPCNSQRTFSFNITGNVCGLSISSPADGQVFDLGGTNYDAATIPLKAASFCTGTVNWTLLFSYTTTGGTTYSDTQATSNTIGQNLNYNTQLGDAGQIYLTAKAELYGQTFQVDHTIYVDGTSIPPATITTRLYNLYSGGATPGLLTGIATHESTYHQFVSRSLYEVPNGLWPNESFGGGGFVGLMQVPNGLVDAFDWLTNTYQGLSTLEGKYPTVQSWVSGLRSQYPSLPDLSPTQYEDNEMVLYAGYNATQNPNLYIWQANSNHDGWTDAAAQANGGTGPYNYVYAPTTASNPGVRFAIQPQ